MSEPCQSCQGTFPRSDMEYIDLEDTQGYHSSGWYCRECAQAVRYEALQLEDEDTAEELDDE